MDRTTRILIVLILIAAVAAVVAYRHRSRSSVAAAGALAAPSTVAQQPAAPQQQPAVPAGSEQPIASTESQVAAPLPRLVDIGAGTCIPCQMMAPILEQLKAEGKGRLEVEVLDLRYQPEASREYNVRLIPTQIFYDGKGKELWRHEGFLSKENIVAKWKEFGVDLAAASTQN